MPQRRPLALAAALAALALASSSAGATALHGTTDARISIGGILQIEDPQSDTFPQSMVDHDLDSSGWGYAGASILDPGVFPPPATTSASLMLDQPDSRSFQARSFALANQKFQIQDALNPGRTGSVPLMAKFEVDFDIQFQGTTASGLVSVNFARFNDTNQVLDLLASFTCSYGSTVAASCSGLSPNVDLAGLTIQEDAGHATFTGWIGALFAGEISDAYHAGYGFASQADLLGGVASNHVVVGKGNVLSFELSSTEEGVEVTALAPVPEPAVGALLAVALAAAVLARRGSRAGG